MRTNLDIARTYRSQLTVGSTILTSTCTMLVPLGDAVHAQLDFADGNYLGNPNFFDAELDGDFDQDGLPDLLSYSGVNGIDIYRNQGDGTFTYYSDLGIQQQVFGFRPVVRDMDRDGDEDIVWHNLGPVIETLHISFNEGAGLTWTHTQIEHPGILAMEVGDIDRDGDLDVFAIEEQVISVHEVEDGELQPARVVLDRTADDYDTESISVGRFDRDADVDVAVLAVDWVSYVSYSDDYDKCYGAEVVLLTNDGNGNFTPNQPVTLPYENAVRKVPRVMHSADLDGDADLDWIVLVGSTDFKQQDIPAELLVVEHVDGSGSFELVNTRWEVGHGNVWESLTAGDLDSDGRIDIALCTEPDDAVYVMRGTGDLGLEPPVLFPTPLNRPFRIATRDTGGDGQLDLVVIDLDGMTILDNISPIDNPRIQSTPLVRNQIASITITGLRPNEAANIGFTRNGWKPTLGLPAFGGLTADMRGPFLATVRVRADSNGTAVYQTRVPQNAPVGSILMQAVARRGPNGATSVKTPFIPAVIE